MVSSSSNLPAIFLWASSWAWCSRCQLSTSAFQHPVVVPTSAIRRPSSVPLSMIEKESPSSGGEDLSEDGIRRRQLLFSLLAAATAPSAMGSFQAHAEEEIQPSILLSKIVEDWSNVDIMKPPTDDRDYVAFKLDNGLRVLLCSDPTISEAGAAMDVHVGACSDPVAVPGLAHFNEHMLFLGTKEYPQEGSFESFLSNNGGSSNAFTDSEDTVYYFSIQAESDSKYSEALKRFGSFFTSPLFTEGATGRELNAIESENAKNLQSDSFRLYQIEKSRQNPQHPHSKFFTGNKQTLLEDTKKAGLNLRNQLIEFYGKYYSANQMTLAVVGPQSTDELTRMVKDAFSNIPNKNVPPPEVEWKGIIPPYNGNSVTPNFGYAVKVVPVQDLRQVSLTWPLVYRDDQDRTDSLLAKQGTYIAHLIGHEGPDSLLSYLKRQGWVNSVTVGSEGELSDYELFQVTISLTTLGLANVYKVLEAVYSYLDLIKQKEIPKYIFEEVLQLEELGWRFSSKAAVSGTVQNLSTSMQKYPISLAVAGPRRLALALDQSTLETSSAPRTSFSSASQLDFTRKLTLDTVDQLTVEKSLVTIISKSFAGKTDQKEKWYGTDFSVEPIPVSVLDQWRNPASPKKLGLDFPKPNVFIPSEAGLVVKNPPILSDKLRKRSFEDRLTPVPPPELIRDDGPGGRWQVYYKPDNRFGQPKAFLIFELLNQEVYSSAKNAALSNIFEFSIGERLNEYAYDGKSRCCYDALHLDTM
jgi:insulysin